MNDRNNRDERNRRSRSSQGYENESGYYGSNQAEQFEDTGGYDQGQWSRSDRDEGMQMGETGRRPIGVYYEEVSWRAPDRGSYADRDRSRNRDRDAAERFAARERDYGGARYDNGLDYYTSESQGGRDFSRRPSGTYGARPGASARGGSYVYDDYDNARDRGFLDRAGDEIASWFGDEEAARRRRMDHRGSGPANYTRSNERVLEDACDRLTDDWQLDARNIQVTARDGEVTLDGTVDSRQAKRHAEDLVYDISGVRHVQNNLRISTYGSGDASGDQTT
jgi:osmotically-inducible protein OsmY